MNHIEHVYTFRMPKYMFSLEQRYMEDDSKIIRNYFADTNTGKWCSENNIQTTVESIKYQNPIGILSHEFHIMAKMTAAQYELWTEQLVLAKLTNMPFGTNEI